MASSLTDVNPADVEIVVEDYSVSAALTLSGLSLGSLGAEQQSAFAQAVALHLGVPVSQVVVGTPYALPPSRRRRVLQQGPPTGRVGAAAVPFTLSGLGDDFASAQAAAASLTGLGDGSSGVAAAMNATSAGVRLLSPPAQRRLNDPRRVVPHRLYDDGNVCLPAALGLIRHLGKARCASDAVSARRRGLRTQPDQRRSWRILHCCGELHE